MTGQVVVLNGAPRSGKSSIVSEIQRTFDGLWMNLGVDVFARAITPEAYRPGMGLRPGEQGHRLAPLQPALYAAFYESIAAHSRAGLHVVADVGHHERTVLADCARRVAELPAFFIGVRCPIDVIMARRNADPQGVYETGAVAPPEVTGWQDAVHTPGIYDLEVDTSISSAEECAVRIRAALQSPPQPSAFERLRQTAHR